MFAVFSAHELRGGRGHAHSNVTTFTHFRQNCCIDCMLALYGSKHPAQIMWRFSDNFILLSVVLLNTK